MENIPILKVATIFLFNNKVFKNELRKLWEQYMYDNISENSLNAKVKKPSYEIVANWFEKAWIKVSKNALKNGFIKSLGSLEDSDTEIESEYESESDSDLPNVNDNQVAKVEKMFGNFNIISDEEFDGFDSDRELIEEINKRYLCIMRFPEFQIKSLFSLDKARLIFGSIR